MRSMLAAAATVMVEPPRPKPPQVVMPGQVVGIRNVSRGVGRGPEGSSVLTSENHNLRLDSGSRFVLVPAPPATVAQAADSSRTAGTATGSAVAENSASPAEHEASSEESDCLPPACTVAPTDAGPPLNAMIAESVIPNQATRFYDSR